MEPVKTFKLDVNIPVSKAELDSNWAKLYENCVSHNHNIMKTASVVFTSNIIQYNDITLSWLVCIKLDYVIWLGWQAIVVLM